jgi:hypothetical protein
MPPLTPTLYMIETVAACPTSRTFQVQLDDGAIVSFTLSTFRNHRRLNTSLHCPTNSEINQAIIHLANHSLLKDS